MVQNKETVKINCQVTDVSKTGTDRQKLTVVTQAVYNENNTYDAKIKIQAVLDEGQSAELGQYLVLSGELERLDTQRNPGGYDEFLYLRSRKIQYKIMPAEIEGKGIFVTPPMYIKKIRAKVADIIDKTYPKIESGIMKAIIIGDKSGIDEDTMLLYKDAGIYHILAVSGLHVSIIYAVLSGLLLLLGFSRKKTGFICFAFLIFYCIFTGAGIATVRAVIMLSIVIFGGMMYRKSDLITTASVACIVLLLYEPLYLFDVGFLYSFSAVFGLAVITKAVEALLAKNKLLQKYLSGCIAAFLATAPVSLFFFFKISWISVLVNAVLLPTVFMVVVSGFLSVIAGFLSIGLASFFAGGAYVVLNFYNMVCRAATAVPFSVSLVGRPPLAVFVMYYVILGLAVYALYADKEKFGRRIKMFYVSAAGFVLLIAVLAAVPKRLDVTFLDVGQGDSQIISINGDAVIIDGGGNIFKDIGDNTGKWVVMPYLDYKGIRKVEAAFLSHIDGDHALGIAEMLNAKRIKKLFLADVAYEKTELLDEILASAKESETEIIYIKAGDRLEFLGKIGIECIYPKQGFAGRDNNQSLVLRVSYGKTDFLFTGDIEASAEREIVDISADLHTDVLKIAHHGSKTSSTGNFLEAVSPKVAIAGVSRYNSYGHPNTGVVERIKDLNIPFFSTAQNGAVTILTDGETMELKTMVTEN